MSTSTDAPATLLLHNIFNHGHFLVYASVVTRWALSRGMRVHAMGWGLARSPFGRRFGREAAVTLQDMGPELRPTFRQAWEKAAVLKAGLEDLLKAQRTIRPWRTLLLSADDYLFEDLGLHLPGFSFETPTHALTTFGYREHYTGWSDFHSRRLRELTALRSPFAGILTLDEYHAADAVPLDGYVSFMPDIFREDEPVEVTPGSLTPRAQALHRFLDGGHGPVIPIIGKFDRRKNNLWTLEAAADTPDCSCVVLGQRVPGPDDREIETLLHRLRREERLFECDGYVEERLFHMVLSHERTPFLPLPYACHYGSSGIQLLGLSHDKPAIVPTGGLMARRVQDHGLGLVVRSWDRQAFRGAFDTALHTGPAPYAQACRTFMTAFTDQARAERLDAAFGLAAPSLQEFPGLGRADSPLHRATRLFWLPDGGRDAEIPAELHRLDPDDASLQLRKACMLFMLGRSVEASQAMTRGLERGGTEEYDFFEAHFLAELHETILEEARRVFDSGRKQEAAAMLLDLLAFVPASHPRGPLLQLWRVLDMGIMLAQSGEHRRAADCFREVLRRDPGQLDVHLNLSDVLRYAKRYEESLQAVDALEMVAPGWPGIHHKRGQVRFEQGRLDEARELFLQEPRQSKHHQAAQACLIRIRETAQ